MPKNARPLQDPQPGHRIPDRDVPLAAVLHVKKRPPEHTKVRLLRWIFWISAGFNFLVTIPFLVNSILYHLFDVFPVLIRWADKNDPTRPFALWTFLGFGALWGCFFLAIAARPVERRTWIRVAIAEKLVPTIAVWVNYLFVDGSIGWQLPVLVLGTDFAFVFIFWWTLRMANDLAAHPTSFDDAVTASAARIPAGSSPPARWLLKFTSVATVVLALLVLVANVNEVRTASSDCFNLRTVTEADCPSEVLGTPELWSLPPLVVWIWAGMELVISFTMLWASRDVVRRRSIISYGIAARLVPIAALLVAQFATEDPWNPSNGFTWWVVSILGTAALFTWAARRWANASALALGADVPARVEPAVAAP